MLSQSEQVSAWKQVLIPASRELWVGSVLYYGTSMWDYLLQPTPYLEEVATSLVDIFGREPVQNRLLTTQSRSFSSHVYVKLSVQVTYQPVPCHVSVQQSILSPGVNKSQHVGLQLNGLQN